MIPEKNPWDTPLKSEKTAVLPVPKMKSVYGIVRDDFSDRRIVIDTTEAEAKLLNVFGAVYSVGGRANRFSVIVDARYDYGEVYQYIKHYKHPVITRPVFTFGM